MKTMLSILSGLFVLISFQDSFGDSVFFIQDVPYLSQADIPPDFYAVGSPDFLEDFEDGTLDGGITVSSGGLQIPPWIDSVDADDGVIDGSGSDGHSWAAMNDWIRFSFSMPYPTAAALAITDAHTNLVQFEAFDSDGVSLGTYTFDNFGDGSYYGGTSEDRFFAFRTPAASRRYK